MKARAAAALLALLAVPGCGGTPGARPAAGSGAAGAARAVGAAATVPVAPDPADPYAGLAADDPHGRPIPFGEFAGKVRVIDLWASWCGPCRMTIPELNGLYARYRDQGLVVIGLSVDDDPAEVLEFQHQVPMRYPSGMFNRGLAARLGEPSSIPTTLLVDRRGVLRRTFVGFVDARTLESVVQRLL